MLRLDRERWFVEPPLWFDKSLLTLTVKVNKNLCEVVPLKKKQLAGLPFILKLFGCIFWREAWVNFSSHRPNIPLKETSMSKRFKISKRYNWLAVWKGPLLLALFVHPIATVPDGFWLVSVHKLRSS